MVERRDMNTLFQRAGLTLSQEELDMVKPLIEGYLKQLEALHSVDLEGEEVQGAFMSQEPRA